MEESFGCFFFELCLSFAGHGFFFFYFAGLYCTFCLGWMDGWGSRKWGEGRRGKLGGMGYDLE
jgi:hypothetical protein